MKAYNVYYKRFTAKDKERQLKRQKETAKTERQVKGEKDRARQPWQNILGIEVLY